MEQLTRKNKKGFSTIELMIAMAIMVLVLTAVVETSFGSQSFLESSQTNSEAMKIAQGIIEQEQAVARKDFNLVNATATSYVDPTGLCSTGYIRYKANDIYCERVDVVNQNDSGVNNYFEKNVTVIVTWKGERGMAENATLQTLISNLDNTASSNTCNSSPTGNWSAPHVASISIPSSNPIAGIDVYQDSTGDKLYTVVSSTSASTNPKFLVFTLSSTGIPTYLSGIDTTGTTQGANALTIVSPSKLNPTDPQKTYAFVANAASPSPTDWNTCTKNPATGICSQLEILDVSNPTTIPTPIYLNLGSKVTGSAAQGIGKSIYYRNGYIFLGLSKGAGSSDTEFNVIDIHNPLTPQIVGGLHIGAGVEAIYVSGNYAYLATDDKTTGNSLTVVDVSNPTAPVKKWPTAASQIFPSSFGWGNAVTSVGDLLYFGMTYNSTSPEFFTLNDANPSTLVPAIDTTKNIDLGGSLGINGMAIRDNLVNLLTSSSTLRIRNTTTSTDTNVTIPGNGTAMDCQGNYLYVGDSSGKITTVTGS